jgi:hypothetical protein
MITVRTLVIAIPFDVEQEANKLNPPEGESEMDRVRSQDATWPFVRKVRPWNAIHGRCAHDSCIQMQWEQWLKEPEIVAR